MASPAAAALLVVLALARALDPAGPCAYEKNQIKDLLQADCEGRGLTQVPPGLEKDTGILLLSANRLAQVSTASFGHLHNLTDLDLSRNGLGELEATAPLPGLRELDLSHNALRRLPALEGFPGLLRLALGHNALSGLPQGGGFRALRQLVDLELQGNGLETLPEAALAGLAALKDLDLSDNCLTALPPELLAGLGSLETLRLERNRLQSVPEGFFPEGHFFAYVYLTGNPWLCDCALDYLRNWITENAFSVYTRVQGPQKEITENQPEKVTCHNPPDERGQPVMDFSLECRPESERGGRGDESEILEPLLGPGPPTHLLGGPTPPPVPPTSTASFTQPEPSSLTPTAPSLPTNHPTPLAASPTSPGSLATASPTARGAQAAPATSPPGLPPASSTATPLPPSPSPPGSLATAPPTAKGAQAAPTTSPPGPPPASTTATPGATPSTPPPQTTPATPRAFLLPATAHPPVPAHCQCPLPPGLAFGLRSQQPSPVSWGGWLAAHCCPLRLVLYVACLWLVSLPPLALLCWRVTVGTAPPPPPGKQKALGPQLVRYQQLQNVAWERHQGPGEGGQPLPGPRLYRVCRRLEMAPLRHVTWLLVSLPGPSGRWPWEREGSSPSSSLDAGKAKYAAAATL